MIGGSPRVIARPTTGGVSDGRIAHTDERPRSSVRSSRWAATHRESRSRRPAMSFTPRSNSIRADARSPGSPLARYRSRKRVPRTTEAAAASGVSTNVASSSPPPIVASSRLRRRRSAEVLARTRLKRLQPSSSDARPDSRTMDASGTGSRAPRAAAFGVRSPRIDDTCAANVVTNSSPGTSPRVSARSKIWAATLLA